MSSSTPRGCCCSTPDRTAPRSPTRPTSPAGSPASSTIAWPGSTSASKRHSPPSSPRSAMHRPMSTPRSSPTCTRTTSAGFRNWAAPTCWSPRPSGRSCPSRRLSPAASCEPTSSSRDCGGTRSAWTRPTTRPWRRSPGRWTSWATVRWSCSPPPGTRRGRCRSSSAAGQGRRCCWSATSPTKLRCWSAVSSQVSAAAASSPPPPSQVLALKERMPDLAILPAHDPTAAQRLLES